MNFKRRSIILMILIFSSLFVLGAQTRPSIAIRALSGGSGNDGELIAVMLSTQRVIQNNFTVVNGASDYEITGTIVRDGLGHIAHIVIYRGGTEIGRESLFYRAFIEVSAYMPTVAASLARSADSSIAAPSNARTLPELPEAPAVAAAPSVPAPRPATPAATPPVSTPPPAPTQRLPLPTQRVPAPQPDTGEEEEGRTRREPPPRMSFYTGAFLGFGGIGAEALWYPFSGGGLGVRAAFSSWRGNVRWRNEYWADYGGGWGQWITDTEREDASGSMFSIGLSAKFAIASTHVNLILGYSTGGLNFNERNDDSISVSGFHWGADVGMRLGPGVAFVMLYGANLNAYEIDGASNFNFGVGYRMGFGAKTPRVASE